jgi:RNA polymerase sigma factor (sigma-70 family)
MVKTSLTQVVRHVRLLAAAHCDSAVADADLLEAFLNRRDQEAFTALVHRHGPMVLSICNRVLHQRQDAEDAFQATFLLMARKAASLQEPSRLASWLYGTARRMALSLRRGSARRRAHEGRVRAMRASDPSADLAWREVQAFLDEEIGRLPEKYQVVFVLRCVENKSQAEVAALLGLKPGTVSSRLDWARKRLQSRLAQRGVTLSGVLAALALAPSDARAVPVALCRATTRAAVTLGQGNGILAGLVSSRVAALVEGGLNMMLSGRQLTMSLLLGFGLLASAAALVAGQDASGKLTKGKTTAQESRTSRDLLPSQRAEGEPESIRGSWILHQVEREGRRLPVEPGAVELAVTHRFWIWQEGGKDQAFVYELHPDRTPKQIDLSRLSEGQAEQTEGRLIRGIYAIAGDELRICESAGARPSAFTARSGSDCTLYTYRRSGAHRQSDRATSRAQSADDVRSLEAQARKYLRDYRLTEARGSVDRWLELQPNNPEPWLLHAQIVEQLPGDIWNNNVTTSSWGNGFSPQALADYRRVLELDAANDTARLRLAEALLDSAQPQEALGQLQRLQERQPQNSAVRLAMARCLIQLGRLAEGARLLDGLLAHEPRNAAALVERGKLALQEGNLAEAENLLRQALAITPLDRQAIYVMFQSLSAGGKADEARPYREALTRLETDYKQLQEVFKKILKAGDDPTAWAEAGSLLLRTGREKEGLASLHRAVELDPSLKQAHQALADYYERQGKKELAAKHRALAK